MGLLRMKVLLVVLDVAFSILNTSFIAMILSSIKLNYGYIKSELIAVSIKVLNVTEQTSQKI